MNYSELEKANLISAYKAPKEQISKEMRLAARDIRVAKANLAEDNDWAFAIAYNALLQAGRALMLFEGYRSRGEAQHKTVIRFLELSFGNTYRDKINYLDKMRINRHRVLYDEPELISNDEAQFAIQSVAEFVELIKVKLGMK